MLPYAQANQALLNLNSTFLAHLESLDKLCGYAAWREEYLTFPPPGNQPSRSFNNTSEADYDVLTMIDNAALAVNPCFDIYVID